MKDFKDKLVCITGGSSGMGLALAKQCAGRGSRVFIIARRQETLQHAVKEIMSCEVEKNQSIGSICADVTRIEELKPLLLDLVEREGPPDLLINAAGACHPARFEDMDHTIFRSQMDLNFFGTLHSIQILLPGMCRRGSGHIVNICSTAGFISFYGFSAYSASKYAVRGFSDALRTELKLKGIQLSLVFPPDTDTPGLAQENKIKPAVTRQISAGARLFSPEKIAQAVLHGVERNRYMIIPGFENKLIFTIMNILGSRAHLFTEFLVRDALRKTGKN